MISGFNANTYFSFPNSRFIFCLIYYQTEVQYTEFYVVQSDQALLLSCLRDSFNV